MRFPTGGIAHEPFKADSVKFRSRRYSPDERRENTYISVFFCPWIFISAAFSFPENERIDFMKKQDIRKLTVTAIMGAIGFILMMVEFPIPSLIPVFIKFDFSELPALITAFAVGPCWGVAVCLIKNLLHLFVSNTAGVGELSNFVLGAIFVFIAGEIYKRRKTRGGALVGTLAGSFTMAAISVLTNYFFVYPLFAKVLLMPMEVIIGMYQAILPSCDNLLEALIIFNFPFNLVKGLIDAAICFLVYKKLSPVLKVSKK